LIPCGHLLYFFVIIEHFGVWFDDTSVSGKLVRYVMIPDGGFGVDLFFVLSGFLITSILFNAKNSSRNTSPFLIIKNFFVRRALRIFPIYYLLLFLLFFFHYPDIKEHMGYYLTYTANILCFRTNTWNSFSHTWTLDVEEQFYLLWPWLVIFIKDRNFKYAAFISILLGIVSTYIVTVVQNRIAPFLVFNCMDSFAIGGLYARARLQAATDKKFAGIIKIITAGALAVYFYWKLAPFTSSNPVLPCFFLAKTINSIISVWLIMLVVNNKSKWIGKYILGNSFFNFIGKISYGLYLYHYVYINGYCGQVNSFLYHLTPYPSFNEMIHSHHFDYWIQVSIMAAIAALSYILIEKPLLRLKNRFNYNDK
jgi:peptidoglycan/LPS O-acetylase OafA/YrhL